MQSITPPPPPPGPAAGVSIIGTSRDGRLRFTPGQRVELLAAFDRGGQSAMSFARSHGVNYQTFIAWLLKRREHGIPAAARRLPRCGLSPRHVPRHRCASPCPAAR